MLYKAGLIIVFYFASLLVGINIHASSCGVFNWSNCSGGNSIRYCTDGKCNLSGSLQATERLADGLFTKKSLSNFIQDVVRYFLGFITLIAVIYVIYAGFQLMTGGGDEEKAKTAKKIIIYVIVGIIIMWIAYWIVALIIGVLK